VQWTSGFIFLYLFYMELRPVMELGYLSQYSD